MSLSVGLRVGPSSAQALLWSWVYEVSYTVPAAGEPSRQCEHHVFYLRVARGWGPAASRSPITVRAARQAFLGELEISARSGRPVSHGMRLKSTMCGSCRLG